MRRLNLPPVADRQLRFFHRTDESSEQETIGRMFLGNFKRNDNSIRLHTDTVVLYSSLSQVYLILACRLIRRAADPAVHGGEG